MKYYQFISETNIEEYDKKYVVVDGKQISHPSSETLLKAGIKPCRELPEPVYNPDTEALEYYYVNEDIEIVKKWRIVEVVGDELTET